MKRKPIRWRDKELRAGESGWTDWQYPQHRGYRLSCCDCGLVHGFDFRVDRAAINTAAGRPVNRSGGNVAFRVMRDNRSTASHRRHKEPTLNVTFLHHATNSLAALYAENPDQLPGFIKRLRAAVRRKRKENAA